MDFCTGLYSLSCFTQVGRMAGWMGAKIDRMGAKKESPEKQNLNFIFCPL